MLNLTEVELVLDPFMGSGTTGRVCDKLGRSFVGYDLMKYKSREDEPLLINKLFYKRNGEKIN
jgi:DNA modification methylase